MQMNKLYLLVALGLSLNAPTAEAAYGVGSDSNGWYAGDCLDPSSFSSTYGWSIFDCDADCWDEYENGSGSSGSTSTEEDWDYSDQCAEDDYIC